MERSRKGVKRNTERIIRERIRSIFETSDLSKFTSGQRLRCPKLRLMKDLRNMLLNDHSNGGLMVQLVPIKFGELHPEHSLSPRAYGCESLIDLFSGKKFQKYVTVHSKKQPLAWMVLGNPEIGFPVPTKAKKILRDNEAKTRNNGVERVTEPETGNNRVEQGTETSNDGAEQGTETGNDGVKQGTESGNDGVEHGSEPETGNNGDEQGTATKPGNIGVEQGTQTESGNEGAEEGTQPETGNKGAEQVVKIKEEPRWNYDYAPEQWGWDKIKIKQEPQ